MFLFIQFILFLLIGLCFAQNGCPADSNIKPLRAHETDCAKFYQCSNGNNFEMTCGPGTVFDERLQVCNWPSAVDCKNKPTPKKPAKPSPPEKGAKPPAKAPPKAPVKAPPKASPKAPPKAPAKAPPAKAPPAKKPAKA